MNAMMTSRPRQCLYISASAPSITTVIYHYSQRQSSRGQSLGHMAFCCWLVNGHWATLLLPPIVGYGHPQNAQSAACITDRCCNMHGIYMTEARHAGMHCITQPSAAYGCSLMLVPSGTADQGPAKAAGHASTRVAVSRARWQATSIGASEQVSQLSSPKAAGTYLPGPRYSASNGIGHSLVCGSGAD